MILYTIISPEDVLHDFSGEESNKKQTEEICTTDPFVFLERDEYYKIIKELRK
ncbi:hypothetical protein [Porcipelethomonas sp.]|uniref:hypothetical protein n=1 Tax=Porcipelethomonas sp. TaxID=2981675 RepID=UPI003EF66299